jgi:hypothetical protein
MTPEQVRTKKNNIFATYNTIDEVIEWAAPNDGSIIPIAISVAVNTTLELIAKEMENEKTNVD